MGKDKIELDLQEIVDRVNEGAKKICAYKKKGKQVLFLEGTINTFIYILCLKDYLSLGHMAQLNFDYNYTIKIIDGEKLQVIWGNKKGNNEM